MNVHLDGSLFFKNVTIDSDEIVAADCWKFKDKIFISDYKVKLATSEMHNSTEQDDLVISHRAPAEHTAASNVQKTEYGYHEWNV